MVPEQSFSQFQRPVGPTVLVLDSDDAVMRFRSAVGQDVTELFIHSVVCMVVDRIAKKSYTNLAWGEGPGNFVQGTDTFGSLIELNLMTGLIRQGLSPVTLSRIHQAVHDLSVELLARAIAVGAYYNGVMPYTFKALMGNTVILEFLPF